MKNANYKALVFERDDYACRSCGEVGVDSGAGYVTARGGYLSVDHIIPISRGGTSQPSNLQTLCTPCNASKGQRTPEEWEEWRATGRQLRNHWERASDEDRRNFARWLITQPELP